MDSKSVIKKTSKSTKKKYINFFVEHIYEVIAILILLVGIVFFALHRDYDSSEPIDCGL